MKGVCICLVYLYYLTEKCVLAAEPYFVVPSSGVLPTDIVAGSVNESMAPGSAIFILVAQDMDSDVLTFSIKSQTPSSPTFNIDANKDELRVPADGLDAKTSQTFVFVFSVSDGTTLVDSVPFTLTVTDVNEYRPVFSPASYTGSATDRDAAENDGDSGGGFRMRPGATVGIILGGFVCITIIGTLIWVIRR